LFVDAMSGSATAPDAVDCTILEAALSCIGLYGVERMTMTDVAGEAGVGRATVFRRFDSKDELIRRALAFEMGRVVEGFAQTLGAIADPVEQIVELTVEAVRIARTHPIGIRLVEDGSALAVHRDGEIAAPQLMLLSARIRECADGLGVEVDAEAMAEVLWRFIGSVWLTPGYGIAVHDVSAIRRMVRVIVSPLTDAAAGKDHQRTTEARGAP